MIVFDIVVEGEVEGGWVELVECSVWLHLNFKQFQRPRTALQLSILDQRGPART